MMSEQLIKDVSDVAAYRAAEEGKEPLSIWSKRDATHIPFLGDYTPAGWRRALWSDFYEHPRNVFYAREDEEVAFMVDASGFGARDEPALSVEEFADFIVKPQRPQHEYGWAIREQGQFQIVVGAYIVDPTSEGNPAPDEESVTCDRCHTVHDVMEECNEDYVSRCPACGDVIDYCQGHGEIGDPAGFAILAAHDDDDHSGCHPDGCDEAPRDPIETYGTPEHEAWLVEMERQEG